jgi:hypothetical protein
MLGDELTWKERRSREDDLLTFALDATSYRLEPFAPFCQHPPMSFRLALPTIHQR